MLIMIIVLTIVAAIVIVLARYCDRIERKDQEIRDWYDSQHH